MKRSLNIFSTAIMLALIIGLVGMPTPKAHAAATVLFADDFEGGLVNWSAGGLWNLESETDTCGAMAAPFPSTSTAAYYGQDGICTYDIGARTTGSLTMLNPVTLPASGTILLSFRSYEITENALAEWDFRYVEVSTDGGGNWTLLGNLTNEGAWYQKVFDLSPYLGQSILVRFRFDSVDFLTNSFFGWMVDNVEIATSLAPVTLLADDFENGLVNWSTDGLWNLESETDTCGATIAPFPNPTHAAYYGRDGVCTYVTGEQTSGSLTMLTPITLPASGAAEFSFRSYEVTEDLPNWDLRYVDISVDGGNTWNPLGHVVTENVWYQKTFDLSPYMGQSILLRFRFDSLDPFENNFLGWMVDDVKLIAYPSDAVVPETPVITWNNPADIVYGTALSAVQLNATANTPGTFTYTPAAGTILAVGSHTLHVDFTPDDAVNYNSASKDVSINVLDVTAPTVVSITRVNPNPTNLASVDFTVTFSEPVTGVDMTGPTFDDLILITSPGIHLASISGVSGSGAVYTVSVNTGIGIGTIRLDVGAGGSIVDAALNPLAVGFNGGEIYDVVRNPIFSDVPYSYWANSYIERLYMAGITKGCGFSPLIYCPDIPATRAQLAIMLLRGMHGRNYTPPTATGTRFNDVPLGTFGDAWIEELANEGISNGCGNGNYCPNQGVSRAQMAIFLVRATHGVSFVPPTATGIFPDVPAGSYGADYIEQLVADGVTNGCGNGNYCPAVVTSRTQMAIFLVKAFNLP